MSYFSPSNLAAVLQEFRVLVAGGGTGDDVLQMAEQMVDKEGQVELPHCVVYSSSTQCTWCTLYN